MPTDIYSDDIGTVVQQPHGQSFTVTAVLADGSTVTLDTEPGSRVSWDESRAPRVRAALVCKVPDLDTLQALDPRLGVRVRLSAGYVRPGGVAEVVQVADLCLRKRDVRRAVQTGNLMELQAASDEALVIDAAPQFAAAAGGASIPIAIKNMLNVSLNPTPTVNITHTDATSTNETDIHDRWQTIDDLADRIEADVYDDGTRTWWITPRPALAGSPVATLAVGQTGTVEASSSVLDRDGFANIVRLRYRWTDASNVAHVINGEATATGVFTPSSSCPPRVFTDERDTPATVAQANASAASVLKRYLSRGRGYTLTAVAMWWLRPGDTVTVQLPTGGPESHLVASVEFDPANHSMTVTTRLPDGTGVNGE